MQRDRWEDLLVRYAEWCHVALWLAYGVTYVVKILLSLTF